jgi:hypothetical protein
MSIVEGFYVVFSVGLAWVVLSFPYLIEKLVKVIIKIRGKKQKPLNDEVIYMMILGGKYPNNWEKIKAFARAIEKAHGIGVDDEF